MINSTTKIVTTFNFEDTYGLPVRDGGMKQALVRYADLHGSDFDTISSRVHATKSWVKHIFNHRQPTMAQ